VDLTPIPMSELKVRRLYRVNARNFNIAVWDGKAFIGIRHKFGGSYLFGEHCIGDPAYPGFDSCTPLEDLGKDLPAYLPVCPDSGDWATIRKYRYFIESNTPKVKETP